MKAIPYWPDNTPFPEDIHLSRELPSQVDVAIVGSGFTGLSAAITLAKAGVSVVVFEKETIGWGASSRNGGIFSDGLFMGEEALEAKYGREKALAFWQWSIDACDYVEEMVEREKIECDYRRSGEILLASKPSHFEALIKHEAYKEKVYGNAHSQLLDADQIEEEIGSKIYYGGRLNEGGGVLDPAKYVYGLARLAVQNGVLLFEKTEVQRIRRENGTKIMSTSSGEVKAGEVLLATNGYTGNLVPRVRHGIISGACYSIVTEPLSPQMQEEINPNGRCFYDSRNFINYFRLTADGRVLIGGRTTLAAGDDLTMSGADLRDRLVVIHPQLKDVQVSHSWSGQLGLTFDQMPHVGYEGGVHFAYGYFGHGVILASYLGREMGLILSGQQEGSLFQEIKHPRYFFASWERLYMPLLNAYFRFGDWMG